MTNQPGDRPRSKTGRDSEKHRPAPDAGQSPSLEELQSEYRHMLSRQPIDALQTMAAMRGIGISGELTDPLEDVLSAQLSDLESIREAILALDESSEKALAFLHLKLAPGDALADDHLTSLLTSRVRVRQVSEPKRTAAYQLIVDLSRRGLLLSFAQDPTVYYSLPRAVRVCLPPQPGLVPADQDGDAVSAQVRGMHPDSVLQEVYSIWSTIAERAQHRPDSVQLRPAPPRQPIEDKWAQLREWRHLPSEVRHLASRKQPRSYSARSNPFGGSITVPPAAYRLRVATLRTLREQTGHSDQKIEFYYRCLEGIGAVSGEPGQAVDLHPEAMHRFLILPLRVQIDRLWHVWETDATWSEMDMVLRAAHGVDPKAHPNLPHPMRLRRNLVYSTFKPAHLYQEWQAGRQTVIRFLSMLKEGTWISLKGFLSIVFAISPRLLHTQSGLSTWWLESLTTRRQFGTTFDDWQQSTGRYVHAIFEGPLLWLGIVDLRYKDDSRAESGRRLTAFRITPTGALVLRRLLTASRTDLPGTDQPASIPTCSFGDDLTVTLVPNRAPEGLYDLLRAIGQVQKATPDRFVFRITAKGVLEWIESARLQEKDDAVTVKAAVSNLISSLNALCRAAGAEADVPASWHEKLNAWGQNYGKLHVYEGLTVIELADDYAIQELMVSTSLREHVICQFSPRMIAIQPDAVEALVEELKRRGYTPRME